METLRLTICHYLNCESHIHLGVLRKNQCEKRETNRILDASQGCNMLQLQECECECETSAAQWLSLLETFLVYLAVRF